MRIKRIIICITVILALIATLIFLLNNAKKLEIDVEVEGLNLIKRDIDDYIDSFSNDNDMKSLIDVEPFFKESNEVLNESIKCYLTLKINDLDSVIIQNDVYVSREKFLIEYKTLWNVEYTDNEKDIIDITNNSLNFAEEDLDNITIINNGDYILAYTLNTKEYSEYEFKNIEFNEDKLTLTADVGVLNINEYDYSGGLKFTMLFALKANAYYIEKSYFEKPEAKLSDLLLSNLVLENYNDDYQVLSEDNYKKFIVDSDGYIIDTITSGYITLLYDKYYVIESTNGIYSLKRNGNIVEDNIVDIDDTMYNAGNDSKYICLSFLNGSIYTSNIKVYGSVAVMKTNDNNILYNVNNGNLLTEKKGTFHLFEENSDYLIYFNTFTSKSNLYNYKTKMFISEEDFELYMLNDSIDNSYPNPIYNLDLDYIKVIENSKLGYIDLFGNNKIKTIYTEELAYINGYFIMQIDSKVGVVDKNDNIIIPFEYDSIEYLDNSFLVEKDNTSKIYKISNSTFSDLNYGGIIKGKIGSKLVIFNNSEIKLFDTSLNKYTSDIIVGNEFIKIIGNNLITKLDNNYIIYNLVNSNKIEFPIVNINDEAAIEFKEYIILINDGELQLLDNNLNQISVNKDITRLYNAYVSNDNDSVIIIANNSYAIIDSKLKSIGNLDVHYKEGDIYFIEYTDSKTILYDNEYKKLNEINYVLDNNTLSHNAYYVFDNNLLGIYSLINSVKLHKIDNVESYTFNDDYALIKKTDESYLLVKNS